MTDLLGTISGLRPDVNPPARHRNAFEFASQPALRGRSAGQFV